MALFPTYVAAAADVKPNKMAGIWGSAYFGPPETDESKFCERKTIVEMRKATKLKTTYWVSISSAFPESLVNKPLPLDVEDSCSPAVNFSTLNFPASIVRLPVAF